MRNPDSHPTYMKHKLDNVINITKVITVFYMEFKKDYRNPGETHDFWELVYVDSGEIIVQAGKTEHILEQGSLIFHRPNEFHNITANQKSAANVFITTFHTSSKAMFFFQEKKFTLSEQLRPYIKILMQEGKALLGEKIIEENVRGFKLKENPPFGCKQIFRTTLEQLLIHLIRTQDQISQIPFIFPDKESIDNHLVGEVIKLLCEHIYKKITVEEICKDLSYSKAYISKIFKENCGCTIVEYYTELKVKEAKRLIREQNHSLTEISDMLCFHDPHYFSRVFKEKVNMTPSEYRKSILL